MGLGRGRDCKGRRVRQTAPVRKAGAFTAIVTALILAGCGGDGDDGDRAPARDRPPAAPKTADDPRPPAPDDPISDRPGGPKGPQPGPRPPSRGAEEEEIAEPDQQALIERSYRSYVAALNRRDGRSFCALLAPGGLRGVVLPKRGAGCARSVKASIGHVTQGALPRWLGARTVDVDRIEPGGGAARLTGTVVHRFAGGREPLIEDDVVYLDEVGDRWLIAKPSATFYRAIGARDVPIDALTPP